MEVINRKPLRKSETLADSLEAKTKPVIIKTEGRIPQPSNSCRKMTTEERIAKNRAAKPWMEQLANDWHKINRIVIWERI